MISAVVAGPRVAGWLCADGAPLRFPPSGIALAHRLETGIAAGCSVGGWSGQADLAPALVGELAA